ncbi:hypothetical protein FJ951_27105 [Mesorhizobium sp. B2-2-3]|uniref:hypothetical protein n=1 Tax=Mesorhizobium sp. B2-2-3 TaxID=2589963 RepID=UPI001125D0AB|nr:hypothetical protein [Mesorhizobium sp. B2-2-3]TPM39378.1 hypothetical protein FJ951_27105 [Mesorhizobium sp. B2-2-3]
MSKPQLGAGDVDIVLEGETFTLRPTLKAAQAISRQAGGIMGALRGLANLDLDVATSIVADGLGKKPSEVEETVWRTGIANLNADLTRFVMIVANGGRPPTDKDGGEVEVNPPKAASA